MSTPEEARKQIALTSLSTLPNSAKGFWWTDDDLATILAASDGEPGPLNRLYRTELDLALRSKKFTSRADVFCSSARLMRDSPRTRFYYFLKADEEAPSPSTMGSATERAQAKEGRPAPSSIARDQRRARQDIPKEDAAIDPRRLSFRTQRNDPSPGPLSTSPAVAAATGARFVHCRGYGRPRFDRWMERRRKRVEAQAAAVESETSSDFSSTDAAEPTEDEEGGGDFCAFTSVVKLSMREWAQVKFNGGGKQHPAGVIGSLGGSYLYESPNRALTFRGPGCTADNPARVEESTHGGAQGYEVCASCLALDKSMRTRLRTAMRQNREEPNKKEPFANIVRDPYRARQALKQKAAEVKKLRRRENYRAAAKKRRETGIDVNSEQAQEFNEVILETAEDGFDVLNGAGYEEESAEYQIWQEAVDNASRAKRSGKGACRFSPLTIRFAMTLLNKAGRSMYNNIRGVFPLPSGQALSNYSVGSSTAADGFQHEAVGAMKRLADEQGHSDAQRRGALAFDSMKIAKGLCYSAHKQEVIGFGSDLYDRPDIIAGLFKAEAAAAAASGEGASVGSSLATEYLVFYFTALDAGVSTKGIVARYSLSSITTQFLLGIIEPLIVDLDSYAFVVEAIVADAANENKSSLGALCDIPASFFVKPAIGKGIAFFDESEMDLEQGGNDGSTSCVVEGISKSGVASALVMDDKYPGRMGDVVEIDLRRGGYVWTEKPEPCDFHHPPLPPNIELGLMVAFEHPTRPGGYIFVLPDMPHLVKRIVNALEASNPSNNNKRAIVKYDGGMLKPVCTKLLQQIDELLHRGSSTIRQWPIIEWDGNAFSKMNVKRAFNILSATVARTTQAVVDDDHYDLKGREMYGPIIELAAKVNRLVDIFNSAGEKGAPIVDSPSHFLLNEAISILGYFGDWRADLNGRVDNPESAFFPKGIYDDLNSLVLGFTALARCHLRRFPSSSVVQRRCNQDCCEHHFSHQRQSCGGGVNPTSVQAAQASARSSDIRCFSGSGNSGSAPVYMSEATAPLAARK